MIKDLKRICNLIVGEWYCEDNWQKLIFDLNDNLLRTSKMTIIDFETPRIEINYVIAILPDIDEKEISNFTLRSMVFQNNAS